MITVYVDVLFLINFSVDYIVLTLTASIFHYRAKRWREMLTAFLLSLYALWALLLCGSYLLLVLTAIAALCLSCRFAFPIRGWRALLKTVTVVSLLSALMGAIVELLFRLLKRVQNNGTLPDGKKVLVFAMLALVSTVLIYFGNRLLEMGRAVKSVEVTMRLENRNFPACLLVDSGNIAIDPLSGRRIIFLSRRYAERQRLTKLFGEEESMVHKRVVCVETAAGKRAIPAYLCDCIVLPDKVVRGMIAIMQDTDFQGYDGVFPAALL